MPTAGWWEALWPDPAGVLAKVGVKSGMDVIDLCSGDGWFTLQIAKLARHVVAIDIDPAMLEIARHRLAESDAGNCDWFTCHPTTMASCLSASEHAPYSPQQAPLFTLSLSPFRTPARGAAAKGVAGC